MPDIPVSFAVTQGGGSVTGAAVVTDASGEARVGAWVLGPTVGQHVLTASVANLGSVAFSATAVAGPPDTAVMVSGVPDHLWAGASTMVTVRLTDRFGNPVANANVTFQATAGGGLADPAEVTTSSTGLASTLWTFGGLVGVQTLTTSFGTRAFTTSFQIGPGAPATVLKLGGDQQTGVSGERLPEDIRIRLLDQFGNPVPGHVMSVTSGVAVGQLISTGHDATDANGEAGMGWAPGPAGSSTVTFVVGGLPVTFQATTVPGAPALLVPVGQNQSAPVATIPALPTGAMVTDLGGTPLSGISVDFQPLPGNGSVSSGSAVTDGSGTATVAWTLGTVAKMDSLVASSQGIPSVHVTALALPGPSATLQPLSGDHQSAPAGRPVSEPLVVKDFDQYGNPVPGAIVSFAIQSGGGSLPVLADTTDDAGVARADGWILGLTPGPNTVLAGVAGTAAAVTFTGTGLRAPGRIVVVAGDSQVAIAGTRLPVDPVARVLDTEDQPMDGIEVGFQIIGGSGVLTATVDTSDLSGQVSVGWQLGPVAEASTLAATVAGLPSATFFARADHDVPFAVVAHAGQGQAVTVGLPVPIAPAVLLVDQFSNPIPGIPVEFVVESGGGSVFGGSATTNAAGIAAVTDWILGSAPGPNSLVATVQLPNLTGNPVTFTATGMPVPHEYAIDVRAISNLTGSQLAAFTAAKNRLEQVVTGDVSDIPINLPANTCIAGQPALNETVDDVLILAFVVPIDGPGNILGQAGPCIVRSAGLIPVVGVMMFDEADLLDIEAGGLLSTVILHEMSHVLGFGTIWQQRGLIIGLNSMDPYFVGQAAIAAFNQIGGANYPGPKVPLENLGGPGTADSHWRETVFGTELMTGFVNVGTNPLSLVTVWSFGDLGYQVNSGAADNFMVGPFPAAPQRRAPALDLGRDVWLGPMFSVDGGGTLRPLSRP